MGVKEHRTKENEERLRQQLGSLSILARTWFTCAGGNLWTSSD